MSNDASGRRYENNSVWEGYRWVAGTPVGTKRTPEHPCVVVSVPSVAIPNNGVLFGDIFDTASQGFQDRYSRNLRLYDVLEETSVSNSVHILFQ